MVNTSWLHQYHLRRIAESDTFPRCIYCGGNALMDTHAAQGLTAHHLCRELHKRNLPTPRMDESARKCECCACSPIQDN